MSSAFRVLVVALLLVAAGLGFYGVREYCQQQQQRLALERKTAASRIAIERTVHERDAAERELGALARAAKEAAVIAAAAAPPSSTVTAWEQKVAELRSLLAQHPQRNIPEIALLTSEEFIFFARESQLDGEENQRKALRDLRNLAKRKVAPLFQTALHEYAQAHGGRMPSEILELTSYFKPPIPDAVLTRYTLVGAATFPTDRRNEWLVFDRAPVDELYDTRQMVGSSTLGQIETNPAIYVLTRALAAYSDANAGRKPSQASELGLYMEVPLDAATLNRYFQNWRENPASFGINRFVGGVQIRTVNVPR